MPHPPQLPGSLDLSTQEPLHACCGNVQTGLHMPEMQFGLSDVQALPQLPQLAIVCSEVQKPLQEAVPLGHWQVPFTQILPLLQIVLHEPQLLESVFRLAQAPLQIVWLLEQVIQEPAAQAAPDAHLWPQKPQLLLSVCLSTQILLQAAWPPVQLTGV